MNLPKRCTAIKSLLLTLLLGMVSAAQAASGAGAGVGVVTHLSGPLFVSKADGSVRVLGVQSAVEVGDTLSTQGRGYAKVQFSDDSQLTLQPDTVVTLDTYYFHPSAPAVDEMLFTLKQGGVRSDVGQLGQRSPDRVTLVTPGGRIELRSATALVQYMPETGKVAVIGRFSQPLALFGTELQASAAQSDGTYGVALTHIAARYSYRLAHVAAWLESALASHASLFAAVVGGSAPVSAGGRAPGLYVQVLDGLIHVTNSAGTQNFSAGQFGFTPSFNQPPVLVPTNPGIPFTPPPVFNTSTAASTTAGSGRVTGGVDCEVR